MEKKRNAYRLLVGKPEGNRLGRPKCRWVDNIKMDHLETGWGGVDWISLAQDKDKEKALVNAVINLHKLLGNYQVATQIGGFSSSALFHIVGQLVSYTFKVLLLLYTQHKTSSQVLPNGVN
jgi:hypothetical protein